MLPFLKPKTVAGIIISHRKSDSTGSQEPTSSSESSDGIESCAEALIRAMHAKDAKAAATALRDAFEIMDSEPHEEGEHTNDYDSLNEQAAAKKAE